MRVGSVVLVAAVLAVLGGTGVPATGSPRTTGSVHSKRYRHVLRVPPLHKETIIRRSLKVPKHIEGLGVVMQFRGPNGQLSPPLRAGSTVEYKSQDGKKLLRVRLGARYYPKRHRVSYAVGVKNLGIKSDGARVEVFVTVRYA